jgi:hypothetical protein
VITPYLLIEGHKKQEQQQQKNAYACHTQFIDNNLNKTVLCSGVSTNYSKSMVSNKSKSANEASVTIS